MGELVEVRRPWSLGFIGVVRKVEEVRFGCSSLSDPSFQHLETSKCSIARMEVSSVVVVMLAAGVGVPDSDPCQTSGEAPNFTLDSLRLILHNTTLIALRGRAI